MSLDVVELTRALVRAPSENPPGDERAVVTVLERELADIPGVTLRRHEPGPRRPTLVAAVGAGRRSLVLAAHTDTHPVAGSWTHPPFGAEVDADGRIVGRGTTDNKGAVAAMTVAFRRLVPAIGDRRLVLVANADEETGGADGIASLVAAWDEAPVAAVVAEPSGIATSWESLWVGARGTSRFTVRAAGTATHSSLAGADGVHSAVELLDAIVAGLRERLSLLREPTRFGPAGRLTVVRVDGGEGWGVVPPAAAADCELRVVPGVRRERVEQDVEAAFASALTAAGCTGATLAFAAGGLRWMAPSGQPDDAPIVVAARAAWRDVLGVDPRLGCFPGGTDARLFEAAGVPTVIAGPGALVRAHQPDEHVTAGELERAVDLYESTALAFLARNDWSSA